MNAKVVALVFISSAIGLLSGFIVFQTLSNNGGTGLPEENLELSNPHVWFNQSGWAEAAIVVLNVGERDTTLRKITVAGVESIWSDIFFWRTDTGPISNELKPTSTELSGSSSNILVDEQQRSFQQATSELALASGWTIVLYVRDPGNMTSQEDIANIEMVTISVFSENKLYYEPASIQLTFTFMKTEELKVQSHTWATSRTSISMTVKNTGTGAMTISEWRVNDIAASNVTYTTGAATLEAGATAVARIAPTSGSTFTSGVKYEFAALSATGNKYTYVATAP